MLSPIYRLRHLLCIIAAGHFRGTFFASSSAFSILLKVRPRITLRTILRRAEMRLFPLILEIMVESP
ncbi:unnamed protein product [Hymenolepis diminuta]|uniref:Uncharacterized protein n=1 Tax=Hymenolepis diminuta TaxID=6216 RepID=A0A564ZA43_HYMDI|nr:unnamed protein product [Hymenolepis diminuta]